MSQPVRIPADIDRADTVLANLTARQLTMLAVAGGVLYGIWSVTRALVPVPVFVIAAVPVGSAAVFIALGQRDGMSMDRLLLAGLRQRMSPRHQVAAPEGVIPVPVWLTRRITPADHRQRPRPAIPAAALQLPAQGLSETGVIDLGPDGVAVVAVCSTVNFSLHTATEQEALVAVFGRYLHSLTAPVQVLVRAERLDLSAQIVELNTQAPGLPHPALETAARDHADYLAQLGQATVLLRRQVLLVLREPLGPAAPADGLGGASPLSVLAQRRAARRTGPATDAGRRAAEARLVRRIGEAAELLSPSGIVITPLDAGQATAVLASACNPDSLLHPSSALAGAEDVITMAAGREEWPAEYPADHWSDPPDSDLSRSERHGRRAV